MHVWAQLRAANGVHACVYHTLSSCTFLLKKTIIVTDLSDINIPIAPVS
jgi:hypothetical protein